METPIEPSSPDDTTEDIPEKDAGPSSELSPSEPPIPEIVLYDGRRSLRYVRGEIVLMEGGGDGWRIPLEAVDRTEIDNLNAKRIRVWLIGSSSVVGDYRYTHHNVDAASAFVDAVMSAVSRYVRSGSAVDGASLVVRVAGDSTWQLRRRVIARRLKRMVDSPGKTVAWLVSAAWVTGFVVTATDRAQHAFVYFVLLIPGTFGGIISFATWLYLRGRIRLWRRGMTVIAYAAEEDGEYRFIDATAAERTFTSTESWATGAKRLTEIEVSYDPADEKLVRRRRRQAVFLTWAALWSVVGIGILAVALGFEIWFVIHALSR